MSCAYTQAIAAKLPDEGKPFAPMLHFAEEWFGLDWTFVAAVYEQESLFRQALIPKGSPAGLGDHGNAKGIGQVDRRYHASYLGALIEQGPDLLCEDEKMDPIYPCILLRRRLIVFKGDYLPTVASYNAGVNHARAVVAGWTDATSLAERVASLDAITFEGKYLSSVLARRARFAGLPS